MLSHVSASSQLTSEYSPSAPSSHCPEIVLLWVNMFIFFPQYTVLSVIHSTHQQWGPQVSPEVPLNPFPMGEATIPLHQEQLQKHSAQGRARCPLVRRVGRKK